MELIFAIICISGNRPVFLRLCSEDPWMLRLCFLMCPRVCVSTCTCPSRWWPRKINWAPAAQLGDACEQWLARQGAVPVFWVGGDFGLAQLPPSLLPPLSSVHCCPHQPSVTKAKLRLRQAARPVATQASGCRCESWPGTQSPHPELLHLPSVSSTQSPGTQAPNLMWLLRINQLIRCSRACLSFLRTCYNKVGLISPAHILREQVN